MNFGQALEVLKKGGNVSRSDWAGRGVDLSYLELIKPDDYQFVCEVETSSPRYQDHVSWIGIRENDTFSPWFPTHEDLLAEDWE